MVFKVGETELMQVYTECGLNASETARRLGMDASSLQKRIKGIKNRRALRGDIPEMHIDSKLPDFLKVKGTSQLFRKGEPEPLLSWVKTNTHIEAMLTMMREYAQAYLEDVQPVVAMVPPCGEFDADIIPWFQIGDGHVGMLAHSSEVGHNFDLKIAERELVKAMHLLIDRAPACERCVIQDLGDMTHYQDFTAKSESGHDFDYDSRYPKMIETVARIMRSIVDKALSKFKFVDVIINQGNHSRSNDVWMRVFLKHVYSETARLTILDNSCVFIPYRMGNTFVMCHHSDKCKPDRLVDVMASDFAQDWGESSFRYIDIGHIHHRKVSKEFAGVTVESWNQLAPVDKFAHDGGWRSRSCLTMVERSKTYGEKGRQTLTAEEVKDLIDRAMPGTQSTKRRQVHSV